MDVCSNDIDPKDPLDEDNFWIDFSASFAAGTTLQTAVPTVTVKGVAATGDGDLAVTATAVQGLVVQLTATDGVPGTLYQLGATVTGSDGRILHRSMRVPIRAR